MSRKPWTDKELALLGTNTDAAIAKALKRTAMSVRNKRLRLGIEAHVPYRHEWTKKQISMLGKVSDRELAEELCLTRQTVLAKRLELGIEACHAKMSPKKPDP